MMGRQGDRQRQFLYDFNVDKLVPHDHLLRQIDRFLDFDELREHLKPFYGPTWRLSIELELMLRMLIIGYCYGIRSERRPCGVAAPFAMKPKPLIGDTAYGTAELLGWMVEEKTIEPHLPVWENGRGLTVRLAASISSSTSPRTPTLAWATMLGGGVLRRAA